MNNNFAQLLRLERDRSTQLKAIIDFLAGRRIAHSALDVLAFNQKFRDWSIPASPMWQDDERIDLLYSLVCEEVKEVGEAIDEASLEKLLDGIIDSIYVLLGMALYFGFSPEVIEKAWREVQRSNMAKEGGALREDGKILKPEGWVPPDIAGIIKEAQNVA